MKRMALAAVVLAFGFVAVTHAEDKDKDKPNPTGTWKWEQSFGGNSREVTLTLKLDGDKLTGKISGRQGDTDISDAKYKDGEVSFSVVREFNGTKRTSKYNGKVEKDTIKGKMERETQDGTDKSDWEAKRQKS